MSELSSLKKAGRSSGLSQLGPVETMNVHQKVYGQMRQAIMAGKFEPGEVLTLRALAAALGTSIIPARDAVLRLVTERALESAGRSVRIPIMTLDQLRDVERFRIAIEGDAAALAAERATGAELAGIEQAGRRVVQARTANRIDRFLAANQEFHFAIYRAAHSELLQSIIETLWLQIGPHLGYVVSKMEDGDLSHTVDMGPHDALLAALKARDAEGARRALAADLKDSADVYWPYREGDERKAVSA